MSDHTTLTDTERDSLTECECGHYLNEHSSEGCLATVYDGDDGMASLDDVCACIATPDVIRERAITAIVAARVAAARADERARRVAERDRMRGTGGNRFIGADPTRADLLRSINDQLGDLHEWATSTGRVLDLAEVTISTKRIPSGAVSVSVTADLGDGPASVTPPASDGGVS